MPAKLGQIQSTLILVNPTLNIPLTIMNSILVQIIMERRMKRRMGMGMRQSENWQKMIRKKG